MSSSSYQPLHLDWPGLANARDLGGLPVEGGAIREGALIRTESLTRLTEPDRLRDAGVSLIVDLRRPNESPEPHPFADDEIYVNLPVEDPADLGSAFETALAAGTPYVIDVKVNRDTAVPLIGTWHFAPIPQAEPTFGKPLVLS